MKEQPVIIQFDYDDNYITVVDLILFNLGLARYGYSLNLKQAEALLAEVASKRVTPSIAIICSYQGKSSNDGREIAARLRKISPKTKIIAYTADDEADWGDYLALKSTEDSEKNLITILEKLTKAKFSFNNSK